MMPPVQQRLAETHTPDLIYIKSSGGLPVPPRSGLGHQCKSCFRNIQVPVGIPSSSALKRSFSHKYSLQRAVDVNPSFCWTGVRRGVVRSAEGPRTATAAAGWSSRSPPSPRAPHRLRAASPGGPAEPADLCGINHQIIFPTVNIGTIH